MSNNLRNGIEPISEVFFIDKKVGSLDTITIGITSKFINPGQYQANWVCFDNFRLYSLGGEDILYYKENCRSLLEPYREESYISEIGGFYRAQLSTNGDLQREFDILSKDFTAPLYEWVSL